MFKKIVSNLPFNPSMIHQVGFYADRLRQERSIRRLSFVFIALAMAVQSLAVISPPEKSLAAENNHIINGLQTKNDLLLYFLNSKSDVKDIFASFNVSIDDIAKLTDKPTETISSTSGSDWWTIGRNSLTGYSKVSDVYKQNQKAVQYRGVGTSSTADDSFVYARQLRAWDIVNSSNTYKAWKGTSSATGQTFWILQSCGNLTWIGNWTPPPTTKTTPDPVPELEVKKSVAKSGENLKPGDSFTYRIEYRNRVIGTTAKDAYLEDQFDLKNFDIVSPKDLNITTGGFMRHSVGNLAGSNTNSFLEITARLKNPLASPTEVCNPSLRLTASNSSPALGDKVCITVITPCKYDSSIGDTNNENCTKPKIKCSVVDAIVNRTTREVTYKTTVYSSNEATTKVLTYSYDFGDGAKQANTATGFIDTATHIYEPGEFKAVITITYTAQGLSGNQQADCEAPISFDKDQPLGQQKTVENITQVLNGNDAVNAVVHGGDELEYTLSTLNTQNFDRVDITVADYIGDILDYSELDVAALEKSGGRFDKESKKVIWDKVLIPANSKLESKFRVKMLKPIPATNRPSTLGTSFDCKISNAYGNELTLNVQCPVVKGIETIPNTGPGTSLLIGFVGTAVVGYFFARSRLFAKELDIIRSDYAITGGM